jgi:hypothetical protein
MEYCLLTVGLAMVVAVVIWVYNRMNAEQPKLKQPPQTIPPYPPKAAAPVAAPSLPSPVDAEVESLRRNLRTKCLGDDALVDRLIKLELDRSPWLDMRGALAEAIKRWEQDNR